MFQKFFKTYYIRNGKKIVAKHDPRGRSRESLSFTYSQRESSGDYDHVMYGTGALRAVNSE